MFCLYIYIYLIKSSKIVKLSTFDATLTPQDICSLLPYTVLDVNERHRCHRVQKRPLRMPKIFQRSLGNPFNLHAEVFSFCTKSQRSIQSFCTVVVSFARNKLQKSKTPSSGFKTKMCKVVTKRPVARFFRICHRDFEKPWSVEDGRRNGFLVVKKSHTPAFIHSSWPPVGSNLSVCLFSKSRYAYLHLSAPFWLSQVSHKLCSTGYPSTELDLVGETTNPGAWSQGVLRLGVLWKISSF